MEWLACSFLFELVIVKLGCRSFFLFPRDNPVFTSFAVT